MNETALVRRILNHYDKHPRIFLWRQNTGMAVMHGRPVFFGLPGQADISGVWRISLGSGPGRALFIECKSLRGTQSADQLRFEASVTRLGAIYILARSLADVTTVLGD